MLLKITVVPLLRWGAAKLLRSGQIGLASSLFRAADDLSPGSKPSIQYARSLFQDGRHEDAKMALERMLATDPLHCEANNLAGALALEEADMAAAETYFRRALAAQPSFAPAHLNLGNVRLAKFELDAAEDYYRTALSLRPDYAEALTNLGVVLGLRGRLDDAERSCRKAVELKPDFAGAHSNLGNVILSRGRAGEAAAAYREAIRLKPDLPEALVNLALIEENPGYLVGTIDFYEKQLQRQPRNYFPNVRIAQALQAMNRWDEARERLWRAIELNPDAAEAMFLLGVNYAFVGDIGNAIASMRRRMEFGADPLAHSGLAFDSLYQEECSGEQVCAEFRNWGECWATKGLAPIPPRERFHTDRRLRIGYVSRDFARHSVAYFLEPILANHDRNRIEVFCYSTLIRGDEITERFKCISDTWRDISTLSENAAADLIQSDEIDVLVDLSGHTSGHRLGVFARKPAPVQVSYLGHPATTGVDMIDYRLGDAITDPIDSSAHHYVERLWQLPGCFLTYNPPVAAPDVAAPPLLANGYVTFGSFNNISKINEHVIDTWAQVLTGVPRARLKLKSFAFSSAHGKQRISEGFARRGISAEQLDLIDWLPDGKNHLQLYGEVDIALDTFPYNGTTTTCEALWMGVPVICMAGRRHSARVGASLVSAIGLPELLAADIASFVQIAVELANAPDRLAELRTTLRDRMRRSRLLNHAEFVFRLEEAYREMWSICCNRDAMEDATATRSNSESAERVAVLDLAGVAKIRVPDSLRVITRYVVDEKGDWFEDEIRFVRQLVGAGQVVVDVGANYGVYTLSMAAAVGPSGQVFSFEPAASTARMLRESIALNEFRNVTVIECAVSDRAGFTYFRQESNSELNRIVAADELEAADQTVELTTLDRCRDEFKWDRIDFVKIDAEGHESNVIRGARRILTDFSPLVMAEYRQGTNVNSGILDEFSQLGFQTYRLIPGLQVLAPVARDLSQVDSYLLNLFFCAPGRAAELSKRGLLATHPGTLDDADRHRLAGRRRDLSAKRYAQALSWQIDTGAAGHQTSSYADALDYFSYAQDRALPAESRFAALELSLACSRASVVENDSIFRRLTLARVLADSGRREDACKEFAEILKIASRSTFAADAPFLAPSTQFEDIEPKGSIEEWIVAAVAEWLASNSSFSSFFLPAESLRYWQRVRDTGYRESEAGRCIALIRQRVRASESNQAQSIGIQNIGRP